MKIKCKLLIVFILIGFLVSGCSIVDKLSKNSNPTEDKTKTGSSQVNGEAEIILSLSNTKFNLNERFEDAALNSLDVESLSILRNAIYAKYGYIFSTKKYTDYFSQFSWYTPTSKNVDAKLNSIDNENIKKILTVEENKKTVLRNSTDDEDYSSVGKVDISINGKKETLYIISEYFEGYEHSDSNLDKITLKIGDSQVVFGCGMNDGVDVSVADFDKADGDTDIYITESGPSIDCTTYIYKFNGKKIYKYDELLHWGTEFLYDEKGHIYYWMDSGDKPEFNKYYNYRTKKSGDRTTS